MKKFLLSIFAVLFAFAGVQAQEVTLDFTKNTWGFPSSSSNKTTSSKTYTSGSYSIVLAGGGSGNGHYYNSQGYLMLGKKGATLTLPEFDFDVEKIEVVGKSGASSSTKENIYVGNTAVSTETTGSAGTNIFNIPSAYQAAGNVYILKITSAHNAQITKINVYKAAGGGETPEPDEPETPVAPAAPTLPAACNFDDAMTVEITGIAEGAAAYYSLNGENNWVEGTSVKITETTTVYAKAVKGELSSEVVSATYTKNEPVTPPAEGDYVIDELTHSWAGITGTNYSDWSGKKATSSAVYAGNSAGDKSSIQLRSNNSNSGIVTTKSGGKAKKIVVEWNSGTADGRTLDVYGKNSAYSAATDLYSASTQGTKLGSIVYGTTTELVIDGDYEYIGLRSNSGAMYLTSISISWDASNVVVVPDAPMLPTNGDFVTSKNIEITNFNDYENGTTVYYSINGGELMVYTAAFEITTTCEIVAYAEQDGKKSAEVRAEYTRIAKDPEINIVGDTNADAFEGSIEVEITTENGAVAYYTLNGEEPTIESTEYEGALTIKATATLKVIAVEEGEYRSKNVVDKTFTMALNDTSVDVDANSVTFDATAQGYADKVVVASANITDGISVLFDKGTNSNTTKYYENGEAIRSYGGSYFIVESTVGTITKIVLTYGSGDGTNTITTDCGEFSTNTWVGNANSVKFTIGGSSGNRRIQKITVTYGEAKNESYNLEVTSAGWATLFLDYAVAIPEGVTCYVIEEDAIDGETVELTDVYDVIPANTGVIVKAQQGEYVFEPTDEENEVKGLMQGTTSNKYIFDSAYVLGSVDGVVGLYKADMAGGVWLNNANKAYLPASAVSASAQDAASFSFRFGEGTTGVEKVEIRNEKEEIYDLCGRRIEKVTAPGIYIVNGVKRVVR